MKRTVTLLISALLLGSMLVLGVASKMQAAQSAQLLCSVATLNATYGFQTTGALPATLTIPAAPIAATGTLTFNGLGSVNAVFSMATIGQIPPTIFASGTYQVSSDCTGSMAFTSGSSAFGANFNLVIVESGKRILFVETNLIQRATNSGVATFAVVPGCTAATLIGIYGLRVTGTTATLQPVAAVGTITFDGLGGISNITITAAINGFIAPPTPFVSAGNYTLSSDCTGTMTFGGIQGIGTFFTLVVLHNAKEILTISLTQGDTNTGILTRQ